MVRGRTGAIRSRDSPRKSPSISVKAVRYFIASRAGLFNSGIQQSGSAINAWAMSHKPSRELAFKLGNKLGIETDDTAELVARLAGFNAKELIAASNELMKTEVRERHWLSSLLNPRLSSTAD